MLGTLLTGFIGGVCAWFLTDYIAKPLQRFYDLRREVTAAL
jgi:HAMP domain-containing protein